MIYLPVQFYALCPVLSGGILNFSTKCLIVPHATLTLPFQSYLFVPLKTSENQRFSDVSGRSIGNIGKKKFNKKLPQYLWEQNYLQFSRVEIQITFSGKKESLKEGNREVLDREKFSLNNGEKPLKGFLT